MKVSLNKFSDYGFYMGKGIDKKDRIHTYFRYSLFYKNQYAIIDIDCDTPDNSSSKTKWWTIALTIADDYKEETLEKCHKNKLITGKMGITGLLFAKAAIQDFEQKVCKQFPNNKNILYCEWLDRRRRRVYRYALKKLGYKYGLRQFRPCLWKEAQYVG